MSINVLLVSGSTRPASTNTAALRTVRDNAPDGVVVELFEGLVGIPAFVPGEQADDAVNGLRAMIDRADLVLVCTPEYAGTIPGSLKNAFDWLVGTGEMDGKAVAWLSVAAVGRGGGAAATLEVVLGYLGARLLQDACLQVPVRRQAVSVDGRIVDAALVQQLSDAFNKVVSR